MSSKFIARVVFSSVTFFSIFNKRPWDMYLIGHTCKWAVKKIIQMTFVHANFQKNKDPTKIETKVHRGTLLLFAVKFVS